MNKTNRVAAIENSKNMITITRTRIEKLKNVIGNREFPVAVRTVFSEEIDVMEKLFGETKYVENTVLGLWFAGQDEKAAKYIDSIMAVIDATIKAYESMLIVAADSIDRDSEMSLVSSVRKYSNSPDFDVDYADL